MPILNAFYELIGVIKHHGLQDTSPGTTRGSQAQNTSQSKANAAKPYSVGGYWNNN
jgi:hypothetical protein